MNRSALAVEDEVGDGEERAAEFGVGQNGEAFLGTSCVFGGEPARMFERTGIAYQRSNFFGTHGGETFFTQNGSDEFPSRRMRAISIVAAVLARAILNGTALSRSGMQRVFACGVLHLNVSYCVAIF